MHALSGTRHRLAVGVVVLGLLVGACGTGGGGGGDSAGPAGTEHAEHAEHAERAGAGEVLQANLARRTTDVPTDGLVAGLTAFGHELIAEVAVPDENTVVSPLSIALAMSMARAGARGATASEIDQVLHFPDEGRDAAFNTLTRRLDTGGEAPPAPDPEATRAPDAPPQPPILSIANGLFAQAGLAVRQAFLETLAADYGAGLRTVDFPSGRAAETINEWVGRHTAGRIEKLFGALDPATRLVIANAVYFKADWARPFAEEPTTEASFTLADGSQVQVPTMRQQGSFRYAAGPGWQAVELPYSGGELAMWVLVPDEGVEAPAPAELLDPASLRAVGEGLHEEELALAMPRWDFGTSVDLVDALGALGLRSPFGPNADFSGIAPGLFIGQAVHKATITVAEWGTEAAAATGLAFVEAAHVPPPLQVRADHPFAFAITDRATEAPIFLGTVIHP